MAADPAQSAFDERRYAESVCDRYPEFWARFGGMPEFSGKRVIDFGCGRGGMVQLAMEAGAASALGIDLNAHTVAFAQTKVAPQWNGRAEFVCADIREIEIEPADIIVSVDTMEHVMNLPETLCALVKNCKPGGELFIGFSPLWHSPWGHHRLLRTRVPWAHLKGGRKALAPSYVREMGMNGAAPADYRAALHGLPLEVISIRRNAATNPLKSLALKAMLVPAVIPALEKYFTVGLYWHFRRRADEKPVCN